MIAGTGVESIVESQQDYVAHQLKQKEGDNTESIVTDNDEGGYQRIIVKYQDGNKS